MSESSAALYFTGSMNIKRKCVHRAVRETWGESFGSFKCLSGIFIQVAVFFKVFADGDVSSMMQKQCSLSLFMIFFR